MSNPPSVDMFRRPQPYVYERQEASLTCVQTSLNLRPAMLIAIYDGNNAIERGGQEVYPCR